MIDWILLTMCYVAYATLAGWDGVREDFKEKEPTLLLALVCWVGVTVGTAIKLLSA